MIKSRHEISRNPKRIPQFKISEKKYKITPILTEILLI